MKKVVKTIAPVDVVSVSQVSKWKIYAFKGHSSIYKAHKVCDGKYAFVSMEDSLHWASGSHETLENLIDASLYDNNQEVYEFDTMKEFAEWFVNNV